MWQTTSLGEDDMLFGKIGLAAVLAGIVWACWIPRSSWQAKRLVIMLAGIVALLSLWSVYLESRQITLVMQKRAWPRADAIVDSTRVLGKRAFRPQVYFHYSVQEVPYQGVSDLHMPGFGGRLNRLDSAEKMAAEHQKGQKLAVYYNPLRPQEVMLTVVPSFAAFIKIAIAWILLVCGTAVVLSPWLGPRAKERG
jgi:hypothetical protein